MSKSERTREKIISNAAQLFNRRGFSGTSIADIMQATSLEKGGIYNHFPSKDEIALAAFDHTYALQRESYGAAVRAVRGQPTKQLRALIDVFVESYDDPVISGGCVIMNTAIESDDVNDPAHSALKARAAAAMDEWHDLLRRIIDKGIAKGEFKPDTDPVKLSSLIVASLEGGLMMSKLYNDPVFLLRVADHLHSHIDHILLQ